MTNQCLTHFITLLGRSTKLIHQIDGLDWKALVLDSVVPSLENKSINNVHESDEEEESEEDDDLFGMLGGYESSDDSEKDIEVNVKDEGDLEYESDNDDDEASLLKRAAAVHNALLLSVDLESATKGIDFSALVDAIIQRTCVGEKALADKESDELTIVLSHVLSPSTFGTPPKSFYGSQERWDKVCATNALLALQFLIHLMQSGDTLKDWNRVVLPLLLGSADGTDVSLLLRKDVLRESVFNLSSQALQPQNSSVKDQIKNICNICVRAVNHATVSSNVLARQKKINVVCSVLIHLFDNIYKLTKGSGVNTVEIEEMVQNAMHQGVLIILRGICYETVQCDDDETIQSPRLTIDSLRVITGMLLLKLYPPLSSDTKKNAQYTGSAADEKVVELWSETLMLLSPYSTDLIHIDGSKTQRRRCRNWNHVAPLCATAMMCVVLPTLVSMELPTVSVSKDENNIVNWEVNKSKRCRPALQASVWSILRVCLGRFDDSTDFSGISRSGGCGDGGGRGTSLLSRDIKTRFEDEGSSDIPTDQLLRRRSAHCTRILVEYEKEKLRREACGQKRMNNYLSVQEDIKLVDTWMKYVLVFEMLEMEIELHLVDQVWPTMKELTSQIICGDTHQSNQEILSHLPQLVWEDISSILKRVLLSEAPTLRKLGLYRMLNGDAGITVTIPETSENREEASNENDDTQVFMNKPKSKWKIKKDTGDRANLQQAPLSVISVPFMLDVMIPSFDSIIGTKVGTNMQIDEEGTLKSESITPLLSTFMSNYAITLAMINKNGSDQLTEYVNGVFGQNLIKGAKPRSIVIFFHSVACALESITTAKLPNPLLKQNTVRDAIRTMLSEFSSGGAPKSLQDAMKFDLSLALQHTQPWSNPDITLVLQVLALYPPEERSNGKGSVQRKARIALTAWLRNLGSCTWAENAASACLSAYVIGDLFSWEDFEWLAGINSAEREMGMALCTLASLKGNASETLWPAIFKGLKNIPLNDPTCTSFRRANRSMVLLEFGCRESVLSGMGNGDLVADKNQSLLPPPPNVEAILHNAVGFIISQLTLVSTALVNTQPCSAASGANKSSEASTVSSLVVSLIGQLTVLHQAFPSSVSIPLLVNNTLQKAVESMVNRAENMVENMIILCAALCCGAEFVSGDSLKQILRTCEVILDIDFSGLEVKVKKDTKQALRSVLQYSKWGCMSVLIPMLVGKLNGADTNEHSFFKQVIIVAKDSVDATPVIALSPLFKSVVSAGGYIANETKGVEMLVSLQTTIDTLFEILNEENTSSTWAYMLYEISKLIFCPQLLREEYQTAYINGNTDLLPIKCAFQKLLKMGGTAKSHIVKTVVGIISSAWLDKDISYDTGILAIPYRNHIVELLTYKEGKVDESAIHQSFYQDIEGSLPKNTDSSSITRGFVLVFLSKLPPPDKMSSHVLKDLVHFIIDELMCIGYKGPTVGKPFITGSEEYARATRSWQALCLLHPYITDEKSQDIAAKLFVAMQHNTHGPVRYFIEVFAIQCARKHRDVFCSHFIREINRADLSLQYVSSLMVLGGNIIVGKYSSTFFQQSSKQRIKEVLCGVIPWLSSTQGFSRAIAQLLVHKLIPLIVEVGSDVIYYDKTKDDAVLASIYSFLENNSEMSRLRAKQKNFFDSYDVEGACSLEGLLSMSVDEGEEASPTHLVDIIKDCLAEVYCELHEEDAPLWKHMENLSMNDTIALPTLTKEENHDLQSETDLVNFQRKILPIDALDLNIKSMMDQKLFNAAGKKKQSLIICATLVDKVPNLAGLARTAEIFAASTLVIPNLLMKKQDDFKTISASANDWIEIEECKEEDLLSWLYKKKSGGYTIVGLEQTSSSKCISKFRFPDKTVLLLGKEKEGIPVEFLSIVDQCIEIPQLGIIRSLNVHVTGAIAIWKYTEQMLRRNTGRQR